MYAQRHQDRLAPLSDDALRILNTISLQQGKDQDCVSYRGHLLTCKPAKKSKTVASADKFYRSYIQSLHGYLYEKRPVLYYHDEVRQYMTLYRQLDKQVRRQQMPLRLGQREYETQQFDTIFANQQIDSYGERLVAGIERLQSQAVVTGVDVDQLQHESESLAFSSLSEPRRCLWQSPVLLSTTVPDYGQ